MVYFFLGASAWIVRLLAYGQKQPSGLVPDFHAQTKCQLGTGDIGAQSPAQRARRQHASAGLGAWKSGARRQHAVTHLSATFTPE